MCFPRNNTKEMENYSLLGAALDVVKKEKKHQNFKQPNIRFVRKNRKGKIFFLCFVAFA